MNTRIAFFSDIHSNLEALESTANAIKADKIAILGDSVGYGPNPNEVLSWIRSNADACVKGNHDEATITGNTSWFNHTAASAIEWTRKRITDENLSFLRTLPEIKIWEVSGLKIMMVHGSPTDPLREYVMETTHHQLFDYYLDRFEVDIIALGHTHFPMAWSSGRKLIINPGSVGQPRDGDWKSSHTIVEIVDGVPFPTNARIEYDVQRTADKIRRIGLPNVLAERLFEGR